MVMQHRLLDFDPFVNLMIEDYKNIYPYYVTLVSIALVIPVSSAPCERGFSQQNVLKNKLRNRLSPERLSRFLMIKLVGPESNQLDFLSAAIAFGNIKPKKK
ncbi:hypothetical protein KUTeg_018917 [Tegillarca granosa]|uniref:HAT C-terminal dimerisation domain-containing protein n=1 Tax=Tegillarca granosa TaxID=220873 RepID=A0ABQ9EDM9_TEGGR|nr:hypothetical protein KUTeg_018917 [Tegillarca granosa]